MLRIALCLALVGLSVQSSKQDLDQDVVIKINQQITYELRASYFYQAYSHYFERSDVALPGLAKWFEAASKEERTHATGLMEYVNKRGGKISLGDIQYRSLCTEVSNEEFFLNGRDACICDFMSQKDIASGSGCENRENWKNALWAMEDALVLEKKVNGLLLDLHKEADTANDPHLSHILEHDYLDEQVNAIKELNDYITQLKRAGDGLGEYLFDKQLS